MLLPEREVPTTMPEMRRYPVLAAVLSLLIFLPSFAAQDLPTELSDEEFWKLVTDLSEPGGFFRADNFVSNETTFQYVIPELIETTKPNGVYLGVGPDQNFTYIAALQPKMAFIVDIRRQNFLQHLMYKALFALSEDRVGFLSLLFSRQRPEGIGPESAAEELFRAYETIFPDRELYLRTLEAIRKQLIDVRGFTLTAEDSASIEYVFRAFFTGGPELTYNGPGNYFGGGRGRMPTYSELMTETDGQDLNRSYMSTEENFQFLKDLERRNLIVPVVGNFAGVKALRAVGQYLKDRDASVTAFYLSNVEQYLFQQADDWSKFYTNVGTLPLDTSAMFIRSVFNGAAVQFQGYGLRSAQMISSIPALLKAFESGEIRSGNAGYYDVIQLSR
jgi:hypothetical protein